MYNESFFQELRCICVFSILRSIFRILIMSTSPSAQSDPTHSISLVIPVYQGEKTLPMLIAEITPFTTVTQSKAGHVFQVTEVVLVCDGAIDDSATAMQQLASKHPFVRNVWLSRNYGQHPATLAGMASTSGDWIVTMDEDGQQDPKDIMALLDTAMQQGAQLVYADPQNPPPHGWLRNTLSACAKIFFTYAINNRAFGGFNSFRFVEGEIGRSLAAYCGNSVFLDVALAWVVARPARCPVMLRKEMGRASGYSLKTLVRHFFRLILTSGTRPLRFITLLGMLSLAIAILMSVYAVWARLHADIPVQGWTSLLIVMSSFSGIILFSLGIISEYLAVALNIVMGKPLYLTSSKPLRKPLSHA